MKKYCFFGLLLCIPLLGGAQTYGNEWINYAQKYYKIKAVKDGIYRIDSLTLAKAGIPLNKINPKNFQVFFRGKEQYIYVQGENDGVFNKNDFIEFYGQHNDGYLDSLVYAGKGGTPNPYYSLFNDTSTYYLTWNGSDYNHRMSVQTNTSFSRFTPANYFIAQTVNYGSSQYYAGRRYDIGGLTANDPRYTGAEGWFNTELDLGQSQTYTFNINTSNIYTSGPSATIKTLFAGESDVGLFVVPGDSDHHIQVFSSWNGPSPITDMYFLDTFPVIKKQYTVPPATLASANPVTMTFSSLPIPNVSVNITAVSYIYAQYPHTPNMSGASSFTLYVPDVPLPDTTYLNLNNLGDAGDTLFYDLTNHRRLKVIENAGNCKVLVPNGGGLKQCYIASTDSVYQVNKVIPVGNAGTFTEYVPASRSGTPYIIISNPALWAGASSYAAYRTTTGYDVVLADIEQLYDQYAYGIEKDPLAIRRFCNYAIHKWRTPPQYLLLLGKGIHAPLCRVDTAKAEYSASLVPSWGYPSSDVLLTSGLTTNSLKPGIATGRVAAANETELNNYLNKVEVYESTPYAQWMKRVLHFAGGDNVNQVNYFASLLNVYASIIEKPYFGGQVFLFKKSSPAPVGQPLSDSVKYLINNGVSIMTFLGHASGNNFDVNLDAPSDYNNVGKYPLIIANACFSGDIFEPVGEAISSTSEQFVLDPKGSIGFIATDDLGEVSHLFNYTEPFYQDIDTLMFRKPIGLCLQNTVDLTSRGNPGDFLTSMTCLEMTLHGDPGIILLAKDSLPDYAVTDSSVYFSPPNVTTQIDSFKMYVVVSNLGEARTQPVQLSVTRIFPNGLTKNYNTTFNHIYYQDTAVFTMPVDKVNGIGLNQFTVDVDPSNLLRELKKTNNQLLRPAFLWITAGDIVPVYPYQFAIIPNDTVTLKASTGDPNAPLRRYMFQIDTVPYFNSPWLKSQIVSSRGGVVCATPQDWVNTPGWVANWNNGNPNNNQHMSIKVNVNEGNNIHQAAVIGSKENQNNLMNSFNRSAVSSNRVNPGGINKFSQATIPGNIINRMAGPPAFTFTDSTVYYWRVMRDTAVSKDFYWEQSSFQYVRGKTGWAQAHYYQFEANRYNYINMDVPHRGWKFSNVGKALQCFTYGVTQNEYNNNYLKYNGSLFGTEYLLDYNVEAYAGCQPYYTLLVAVIDPITLLPWSTGSYPNRNQFNNANDSLNIFSVQDGCNYPDNKFIFWNYDNNQMGGLKKLLNAVPKGDYILIYSFMEAGFQSWSDTSLRSTLASLGGPSAHTYSTYSDSVPWIYFTQKGTKKARSIVGRYSNDSLKFDTNLSSNEDFGSNTSPIIGPAQKWDSLSWRQHPLTNKARDSVRLNVIGIDNNGNSKTLMKGITPLVANMYMSSISVKQYPELQLMEYTKDTTIHEPSQMNKWQVFYTPVPEVAVNPSLLMPSQAAYFHKDSMQVGDSISYKTIVQNISPYPIDSMLYNTWIQDAGNTIHYLPKKITKKLNPGDTTLLSAKLSSTNYPGNNSLWFEVNPQYQSITRPEEYHFNNLTREYFYVAGDKINPLLDVTFDGIHILNNDIVSPHPNILMEVMDENKFLALNDTSAFSVYIRNTANPVSARVYFGPQMTFTPAVLPNNRCKILYTPTLQDGTYELSVQAKDRSGNLSASNSYKIDFEVINKSMISSILNYPNPFSTATRFVFTLTGEQVPTYFKIQIMTITGKVIREITENEIGPIHIGRNITEYAWDGTDQFGDKVANGVYLYRVVSSIDGQAIDHYSTSADQYFTKGWGKMYLIR